MLILCFAPIRRIDFADLDLKMRVEGYSRADAMFYKNHGSRMLASLAESLEISNSSHTNIEVLITIIFSFR